MASRRYIEDRDASADQQSAEADWSDTDALTELAESDVWLDAPGSPELRALETRLHGEQSELLAQLEETVLFAGTDRAELSAELRDLSAGFVRGCHALFGLADDAESVRDACYLLSVGLRNSADPVLQADVSSFCRHVAAALHTHRVVPEIQMHGVIALCAMRSRPGFDHEVALDAILLTQRERLDDTRLQEVIVSVLALFAPDEDLARYLVQRGALDDVVAGMRLHLQSDHFQLEAMTAADRLLKHVPADVPVDSFVEAVCASLHAHKANAEVVDYATGLLAKLFAYWGRKGRKLSLPTECLDVFFDVLELHGPGAQPGSTHAQGQRCREISSCCWALLSVRLQHHRAAFPASLEERLVPLAVATLKEGTCAVASSICCSLLADLCVDRGHTGVPDSSSRSSGEIAVLKLLRQADAIDVLVGIVRSCASTKLYVPACCVLEYLVSGSKGCRDAALACGLADVLLQRLPAASDGRAGHTYMLCALGVLAQDGNFAKHVHVETAAGNAAFALGKCRLCADPANCSVMCRHGLRVLYRLRDTPSFERLRDKAGHCLLFAAATMGLAGDEDSQYAGCLLIADLTRYCLEQDDPCEALPNSEHWRVPVEAVLRALDYGRKYVPLKIAALKALGDLLGFFHVASLPIEVDASAVVTILLNALMQHKSESDVIRAVAAVFDALMLSPDKLYAFFVAKPFDVGNFRVLFDFPVLYSSAGRLLSVLLVVDPQRCRAFVIDEFIKLCIHLLRARCAEEARADLYSILLALVKDDEACAAAAFGAGFLSLPKSKQPCAERTAFEAQLAGFGAAAEQASAAAADALLAEEEAEAAAKSAAPKKSKAKKKPAARAAAAEAAAADAASTEGDAPSAPDTPPHELAAASADVEPERAEDAESAERSQSESAVRRRRRAATKAARRGADTSPDAAVSTEPPPASTSTDTPAGDAADDAAALPSEPAAGFTDVARGKSKRGSKKAAAADAAPKAPPAAQPPRSPSPPAPQLSGGVPPLASRPALPLPRPAASSAPPSAPAAERAVPAMPAYLLPTPRAEPQQPLAFSSPAAPLSVPFAALLQPPAPMPLPYNPFGDAASSGSVLPPAAPSIFGTLYGTAPRAALPDASAQGLSNATGEYNCFLNSIVQALFHVRCFRDHLLRSRVLPRAANLEQQRSIALVRALGDLVEALEHGAALRRDAGAAGAQQAVAPTALRLALAELSAAGGEGAMNAMADAAEVLSALYEAFQAVSVANRPGVAPADTSIGRMFGIGVREAAHCNAAGCGKVTHSIAFNSFFHIVPRCATVRRGIDACCAALPCCAALGVTCHALTLMHPVQHGDARGVRERRAQALLRASACSPSARRHQALRQGRGRLRHAGARAAPADARAGGVHHLARLGHHAGC